MIVAKLLWFAGIIVFVVGAYHQTKFFEEWAEDHAASLDCMRKNLLSVVALYSTELSDRCRARRRKTLLSTAAFLGIIFACALLAWADN